MCSLQQEEMDFVTENKICDIHSAFQYEYSKAKISLSEFYEAVSSFFTLVVTKKEEQTGDRFENNIHSIQDVCFFLKTFCSEIELHTQNLRVETDKTSVPDIVVDGLDDIDLEYKPPENPNEIFPFEVYPEIFTYKPFDLSQFTVGQEKVFSVSYIKDDVSFLFFLMDVSCPNIAVERPEFRYDIIPSKGTVFGLLLDGVIYRAVRENTLQSKPKSFKAFLIDVGEIVEVTKDYKMYRLTEDLQQITAQSIYCKLSTNCSNDFDDNENFLQDKLYARHKIRIDRIYKNMLEVTFVKPKPILKSTTSAASPDATTLTQRDSNLNILPMTNNREHSTATTPINHNESLTQEELDELYEEPLNTENALEAVMGYTPQDEKRICKFTNPKTKACFKGSRCRLEHTTILKDGWTKDQRVSKTSIKAQTTLPALGKKINLFIQFVDDLDKFYGIIVPKNCKETDDLPPEQIFKKMNTPEVKSKFKKLLTPPVEFELVFALFRGDWYRAKVLHKLSDILYRVFYIDYGNCEDRNLAELRQWDDAFDCYSFQAIECKLDNISKLKNRDQKAIAFFESLVFQKVVTATVTSNSGPLLVTMQSKNFDIGEQLCAAEYARPKKITQFGQQTYPG